MANRWDSVIIHNHSFKFCAPTLATTDAADAPTAQGASSNHSSDFGLVIKSSRIRELKELF